MKRTPGSAGSSPAGCRERSKAVERLHRGRKQALRRRPCQGKRAPFENEHGEPALGRADGCRESGRPSAADDDIEDRLTSPPTRARRKTRGQREQQRRGRLRSASPDSSRSAATNSTEADERLPIAASDRQDLASPPSRSSSALSIARRTLGPPVCATQCSTSRRDSPCSDEKGIDRIAQMCANQVRDSRRSGRR